MSNYYDVDVFKTFRKSITVKADSPEEAEIIAYALNDTFDLDEEFEYCDDANRLDIQATEGLSPEEWAHPEAAVVFSRENIEDGDYESAKQSIKEHNDYWAARNNRLKEKGVKEYLEKQGKNQN